MNLLACLMLSVPWLAGGFVALALQGTIEISNRGRAVANKQLPTVFVFGLGGLLGYLILGYVLWTLDKLELPTLTLALNIFITGVALIALTALWLMPRRLRITINGAAGWTLISIIFAFLTYTFYMHSLNPLFAWDGLNHWGTNASEYIKASTTSEAPYFFGEYARQLAHWLEKHPKTLVFINAWAGWNNFKLGGQVWATPWLFCMVSICMMGSGYVYTLTKDSTLSILCSVLLATLPLAEAHTLIAGYSELWLAAVVMAGLLLSALGLQHQNFYWIAGGMLIGTLAITVKNTGLGYALCVWGAVASTRLIRHPKEASCFVLVMLPLTYWLWASGIHLDFVGIKIIWAPDTQLFTFGGREMQVSVFPLSQIGINELYSFFINQSFTTVGLTLIFTAIVVYDSTTDQRFVPQLAPFRARYLLTAKTATEILVLGALLILVMLLISQVFLPQGYAYAIPGSDTGNSRFTLPVAIIVIPAGLSVISCYGTSKTDKF